MHQQFILDRSSVRRGGLRLADYLAVAFLMFVAMGVSATPAEAQSASLLLGNPQITAGLATSGWTITTSVAQTTSTTTITYNVTPPAGGSPSQAAKYQVGKINLESVISSGAFGVPGSVTVSFTGVLDVDSVGDAVFFFALGKQAQRTQTGPQTTTGTILAGTGSLLFSLDSQTSDPSTITVTIDAGSATGARLPYVNDFSGSGLTDFTVWRPATGYWFVNLNSSAANPVVPWGATGDVPVPGDYDGDGISDYALWRPSDGYWWILLSSTGQPRVIPWGQAGDIPVPADYDGDGKTDIALWRPSTGAWFVLYSSNGQAKVSSWGQAADIPVPGDYDGDGKSDLAVWRPSTGDWFILSSSTGQPTITSWGATGDVPVTGDYDRDGKTDVAIWRPSTGSWYVLLSTTGQASITVWGEQGDIPVSGDYDGDGKTDPAIWRPRDATWLIDGSRDGTKIVVWGAAGDTAIGQTLTSAPQ